MSNGRKPDLNIFISQDGENKRLTQVGVAWYHAKGDGLNIILEAVPITGKLVGFPPKAKDEEAEDVPF